ncbi:MAG TPA: dienelactone hydrolase family protein [Anaerolineae bacterium]|nr:dienelactone hydrolase family protein [Anaerolineae bacterium]
MSITTGVIAFQSGQTTLEAYRAQPTGAGPFPAVVIIHELWGLNDNIRDIAQRFANEGYVALAVDLFAGRNRIVCMFRFMGGMFTNSLDHQGIQDLKAALTYLSQQPGVDAGRVGAIGFCMGGGFAIAWAASDDRLKVIAPFYGANPRPIEAVARACPIVGSYPEEDWTAPQGRQLADVLDQYDIDHDIKIYPGAKHSFFNDTGRNYNADASTDAWQRTLAFFKHHLG